MHLLESSLLSLANPEKAAILQRFFKTGKGEYGEWDYFLGIKIPELRNTVKSYVSGLTFSDIETLLASKWHEIRMAGAMALVIQYEKTKSTEEKRTIFDFYLAHTKALNNWDLVDLSAPQVFGRELLSRSEKEQKKYFWKLISSKNLWERRVAMVGTFSFLKEGITWPTLELAENCLAETESLMHKASGWMLRELGKRCSREELLAFVDKHIETMPRTMLRYSLEHLPREQYREYLLRGK